MASTVLVTPLFKHVFFHENATVSSDGAWIDTYRYRNGAIEVSITSGAAVEFRGSMASDLPNVSDNGYRIGLPISGPAGVSGYSIEDLPTFFKIRLTSANFVTVRGIFRNETTV